MIVSPLRKIPVHWSRIKSIHLRPRYDPDLRPVFIHPDLINRANNLTTLDRSALATSPSLNYRGVAMSRRIIYSSKYTDLRRGLHAHTSTVYILIDVFSSIVQASIHPHAWWNKVASFSPHSRLSSQPRSSPTYGLVTYHAYYET